MAKENTMKLATPGSYQAVIEILLKEQSPTFIFDSFDEIYKLEAKQKISAHTKNLKA